MAFVGVDGGGTRSRALVVDAEGRELASVDGGPGLVHPARPAEAAPVVEGLVRRAAGAAGVELPVEALWAGLAGAGREAPRSAVSRALTASGVARRVGVGTDVEAAHADAFPGGPGILLAIGTGSIAYAVDPAGHVVSVGGWGILLGDEGSGYRIGLEGLQAVVRSADGREPDTALTEVLLAEAGVPEPAGLVEWAASAAKGDLAALSLSVARLAREGDPLAARIVHRALGGIRALLEAVLARTSEWTGEPPVALVGGLVREGGALREPVVELARELGCDVRLEPVAPERGAARLAAGLVA